MPSWCCLPWHVLPPTARSVQALTRWHPGTVARPRGAPDPLCPPPPTRPPHAPVVRTHSQRPRPCGTSAVAHTWSMAPLAGWYSRSIAGFSWTKTLAVHPQPGFPPFLCVWRPLVVWPSGVHFCHLTGRTTNCPSWCWTRWNFRWGSKYPSNWAPCLSCSCGPPSSPSCATCGASSFLFCAFSSILPSSRHSLGDPSSA